MFKELQLQPAYHPDNKYAGRQFLDFMISGISLRNVLQIATDSRVTPFQFFNNKKEEARVISEFRLQRKTKLAGNRIELYVCEECGDLSCGAITARIIDNGDKITWTEFSYQSDEQEPGNSIEADSIDFERNAYFKALSVLQ